MKRIYIIAGEASGDLHGSNLVHELKSLDTSIQFRGFGGDKMSENGVETVVHYKDIAFMGFKEVLMNLQTISRTLKLCKSDILNFQPDAIILVDYPGFNLRIAKFAKNHGIKVIYYISPQIWAWKESRIKIIKKYVDKMICILPFEKEFYKKWNYKVDYVGHPLTDVINSFSPDQNFYKNNGLDDKPIIAILPGSRKQEIQKILPIISTTQKRFPDYQFIIAGSSNIPLTFYNNLIKGADFKILFNKTYDLLNHAKAGLITSGTATLEAALLNLPFVVCYKISTFSYLIFKALVKINYISLVNLILKKAAVKELIQNDLKESSLKSELEILLNDENYTNKMKSDFELLKEMIGNAGASIRAAETIYLQLSDKTT